jgi:hypothetical protein
VSRFLPPAGDRYAKLKASQQRLWFSADENDLWIVAMALVLDETLVARDGDFRTIEVLALVESPDPIPPEESASGRRYAPRTLAASASQLCACR